MQRSSKNKKILNTYIEHVSGSWQKGDNPQLSKTLEAITGTFQTVNISP